MGMRSNGDPSGRRPSAVRADDGLPEEQPPVPSAGRGAPMLRVAVAAQAAEAVGLCVAIAANVIDSASGDAWTASKYLGMSPATLERVYAHHHPDYLEQARSRITGKQPGSNKANRSGTSVKKANENAIF